MLLNCGVGEDSWESLGLQGDPTSPFWRRSALGFLWREWCWSWNSSSLATSCEELTHWKRLWCWEGLVAGGEGDNRGWDGWMASLTWWTWIWVNSGSWWWTGRPGVLRFMESKIVGHNWATELNWTGPCIGGRNVVMSKARCSCGPFAFTVPVKTHRHLTRRTFLWMSPGNLQKWGGGLGLANLVIDNRELTTFYI